MPPRPIRQTTRTVAVKSAPAGGRESVLDRIQPIGFAADEGIKVLLYGQSGTGKTKIWGTFPDPILAVICSGGNRSGELRTIDTEENRGRIHTVQLKESRELVELVEHAADGKFGTVVLDHATGFQDLILAEILGLEQIPVQKNWGMAQQQQYGQCATQFKELVRTLLSLPQNVVIVAQERTFKDEGQASDVIVPMVGAGLMPSITGWLNSACDYICQTFKRDEVVVRKIKMGNAIKENRIKTGKVEFCARVGPHSVFHTKFRVAHDNLPDVIVNANYEKLASIIRGDYAG